MQIRSYVEKFERCMRIGSVKTPGHRNALKGGMLTKFLRYAEIKRVHLAMRRHTLDGPPLNTTASITDCDKLLNFTNLTDEEQINFKALYTMATNRYIGSSSSAKRGLTGYLLLESKQVDTNRRLLNSTLNKIVSFHANKICQLAEESPIQNFRYKYIVWSLKQVKTAGNNPRTLPHFVNRSTGSDVVDISELDIDKILGVGGDEGVNASSIEILAAAKLVGRKGIAGIDTIVDFNEDFAVGDANLTRSSHCSSGNQSQKKYIMSLYAAEAKIVETDVDSNVEYNLMQSELVKAIKDSKSFRKVTAKHPVKKWFDKHGKKCLFNKAALSTQYARCEYLKAEILKLNPDFVEARVNSVRRGVNRRVPKEAEDSNVSDSDDSSRADDSEDKSDVPSDDESRDESSSSLVGSDESVDSFDDQTTDCDDADSKSCGGSEKLSNDESRPEKCERLESKSEPNGRRGRKRKSTV